MKLNSSKYLLIMTLIISTLTALSSNNWLTSWTTLEINLILFMPLMTEKNLKDQPMKYFILQSSSSFIMLMSLMMSSFQMKKSPESSIYILGIMIKLGLSPFHFWVIQTMQKINWLNCFFLTTLMKFPPMMLTSQTSSMKLLLAPFSLTLMLASISGLNSTSFKKIFAFSSILNTPWMTTTFFLKKSTSIIFILIYSFTNLLISIHMKKNKILWMNQISTKSTTEKINFSILILSTMGLPPTMGFLPKWTILMETINLNLFTLTTLFVISSTISSLFYLNLCSSHFLKSSTKKNFKESKSPNLIPLNLSGILLTLMFY